MKKSDADRTPAIDADALDRDRRPRSAVEAWVFHGVIFRLVVTAFAAVLAADIDGEWAAQIPGQEGQNA